MYMLHIFVEGMPQPFGLRFKTMDKAYEQANVVEGWRTDRFDMPRIWLVDDFGQECVVSSIAHIRGMQILDIARDMDVQVEIARMQAQRNQAFTKEQQLAAGQGLLVPAGLVLPN